MSDELRSLNETESLRVNDTLRSLMLPEAVLTAPRPEPQQVARVARFLRALTEAVNSTQEGRHDMFYVRLTPESPTRITITPDNFVDALVRFGMMSNDLARAYEVFAMLNPGLAIHESRERAYWIISSISNVPLATLHRDAWMSPFRSDETSMMQDRRGPAAPAESAEETKG